jgi:hypothetical protein
VGRPKGSKNKKKSIFDKKMKDPNFKKTYKKVSAEELLEDVRAEGERDFSEVLKKKRGRPKGSKNTPKVSTANTGVMELSDQPTSTAPVEIPVVSTEIIEQPENVCIYKNYCIDQFKKGKNFGCLNPPYYMDKLGRKCNYLSRKVVVEQPKEKK